MELPGSARADVDNIFAALIAHEIGHNLGLEHEHSPTGLLFAHEGTRSIEEGKAWPRSTSAGRLVFRPWWSVRCRAKVTGLSGWCDTDSALTIIATARPRKFTQTAAAQKAL